MDQNRVFFRGLGWTKPRFFLVCKGDFNILVHAFDDGEVFLTSCGFQGRDTETVWDFRRLNHGDVFCGCDGTNRNPPCINIGD